MLHQRWGDVSLRHRQHRHSMQEGPEARSVGCPERKKKREGAGEAGGGGRVFSASV